jgi:hypothetical protein
VERFRDEKLGSRQFFLRLIEIVAILCHDVAAALFDIMKGGLTKPVIPEPPSLLKVAGSKYPPKMTFLAHRDYHDHEHYPRGWTDTVGYWAEDRLFGGVVLFDRGSSGTQVRSIIIAH